MLVISISRFFMFFFVIKKPFKKINIRDALQANSESSNMTNVNLEALAACQKNMVSCNLWYFIFFVGHWAHVGFGSSVQDQKGRRWVTQLFMEARDAFVMDESIDSACRHDFNTYTTHLANQTVWAIRMLESSDWPTMGLLSGITTHLGNWAECLAADNGGGVTGQYCLVQTCFNYTMDHNVDDIDRWHFEDVSAWRVMQKFETSRIRHSRLKLLWAICVPSSCSVKDITTSLKKILVPIFENQGISITINLQPNSCSTSSDSSHPWEFYFMSWFTAILFVIVVLTSCFYTLRKRRTGEGQCSIWQSFTLQYNFERLNRATLPAHYNVIYVAKIFSSVLIIGGHILLLEIQSNLFQTEEWENLFATYQNHAALDSCVDMYSVVSGFLMFHLNFDAANRAGLPHVVSKVVSQWIKLSVLVALHILYAVSLWPYQSDGPLWKQRIFLETENCRQNWWRNLMAIANFFPPEGMCLPPTWYLSIHAQLSILGGILLLAFARAKLFGILLTVVAFLISILWTSTLVYSEGYNSIFLGFLKTLHNLQNEKDFALYVATPPRIGPYIVGFVAAFITRQLNKTKYVFSKRLTSVTLVSTAIAALLTAYFRSWFSVEGRPYSFFENAIYASFSRIFLMFSLPFASFLCIYFTSGYSAKSTFNDVCRSKVWVPLGHLVPNVYLLHYPLLLFVVMSRRTHSPMSKPIDIYWSWPSTTFYSFGAAVVWFFFIESPIEHILKLLFDGFVRLLQRKNDLNENSSDLQCQGERKKIK